MKKILSILFILLFVLNGLFPQNKDITKCQVLILYGKNYNQNTKYDILNFNKTFFASIKSKDGNEPICDLLKNKILAYDPDHYLFHFYLNTNISTNGYFEIKVGTDNKLIKIDSTMIIMSIVDHIKKYYCKASPKNPLRKRADIKSEIIKLNYNDIYFRCIEFKDNWVKVKSIDVDNENGSISKYTGWLLWNNKTKIILDYPYVW